VRGCPQCRLPLSTVRAGTVEIDQCRQCGGAFFDAGEAAALMGPEADPASWSGGAVVTAPTFASPGCPVGHGGMWRYAIMAEADAADVYACGTCRGMWLEAKDAQKLVAVVRGAQRQQSVDLSPQGESAAAQRIGVARYVFQFLTLLPSEVWHPVRKRPVVVYSLLASLTAIFAYQFFLKSTAPDRAEAIILQFGVISRELFAGYGLGTLVTHAFLHAGVLHLLGNLYTLHIFGDNVEERLGRTRFVLLYLLSAIGGAVLYAAMERGSLHPMIGASGAIFGVMGAYLVFFPRVKFWVVLFFAPYPFRISAVWYLLAFSALQIVLYLRHARGVAFMAHIGGLLVGVLLGFLWRSRVRESAS